TRRYHGTLYLRHSVWSLTSVLWTLSLHDALPIFSLVSPDQHADLAAIEKLIGRRLAREPIPGFDAYDDGARTKPVAATRSDPSRSEEHTSELQSRENLVCRLLLEKKKQLGIM